MTTSSSQAKDNWSEIFYTCWFWSVKQTRAATPPSPCCAPLPPPLSDLCLTSLRMEGVQCSLTAPASSVCYHRPTMDQLMIHRDVNIIVCYQVSHKWVLLIVVSPFLTRITVKTSSKVFFPIVLVVEKL